MKKTIRLLSLLSIVIIISLSQTKCNKQHPNLLTDTTLNIVGYLRANNARFSEFVKILDRTNISPYLNAYGSYTCFAPTNDAIALYLKKIGKTSTDQLDTAALKSICRLHLINDTLSTQSFTDGKMRNITLYGQYLITGIGINKGSAAILVNRQAFITLPNVQTGNGYVHEIDHVLEPATQTIAQMIAADSRYSIYTQALKATGLYDSLNIVNNADTTRRWLTFLAESDSVLKVAGYSSYTSLKTKFNNTGNPKNTADSLFLYMAYHIVQANTPDYVADIVTIPSLYTLAPLQVVNSALIGQTVLLNQVTFNGNLEAGIPIDRNNSDFTASNGVMHNLLGDIYIKIRTPIGVYWDVADQPEIRKLNSVFRKAGQTQEFSIGQLADVTWNLNTIKYVVEPSNSANFYYWDDYLAITLRAATNANNYIEFTTPLLVKGKYKVWFCYRRGNQSQYTQISVDGTPLTRIVAFTSYLPDKVSSDAVLESQGFKRYATVLGSTGTGNNTQVAQLAGVVDISTTDRHKLRLTCIKEPDTGGIVAFNVTLDMVEFIPIGNDQQYPRFKRDGTQF